MGLSTGEIIFFHVSLKRTGFTIYLFGSLLKSNFKCIFVLRTTDIHIQWSMVSNLISAFYCFAYPLHSDGVQLMYSFKLCLGPLMLSILQSDTVMDIIHEILNVTAVIVECTAQFKHHCNECTNKTFNTYTHTYTVICRVQPRDDPNQMHAHTPIDV